MSKSMTPTQRNYAVARINTIVGLMKDVTCKKFIKKGIKAMTIGELVKLIKQGTIKPKKDSFGKLYGNCYGRCSKIHELFEIVDGSDYYRTQPLRDEAKMSAAIAKIDTKATGIKDRLMLGDAASALKMVEDFETEAAALSK